LRDWLLDPSTSLRARLDSQLGALSRAFAATSGTSGASRVVVTVFEPGADREDVLDSIRASLA
jgi:hypothetical protein